MKRGFSLIELLVAISMLLVIGAGSLVFINNFNSRKDLDLGREQLVTHLRLARNMAIGRQLPSGVEGELHFVGVGLDKNGRMVVVASKVGGTTNQFFDKNIFESGVELTTASRYLGFGAYKGNATSSTGVGLTAPYTITLQSVRGVEETRVVIIEPSGVIK